MNFITRPEGNWFWLSYAGEEGFRGAVVLEALSFIHAVMRARALNASPEGEVQGQPLWAPPPEKFRDRLLNRDEAIEAGKLCPPAPIADRCEDCRRRRAIVLALERIGGPIDGGTAAGYCWFHARSHPEDLELLELAANWGVSKPPNGALS